MALVALVAFDGWRLQIKTGGYISLDTYLFQQRIKVHMYMWKCASLFMQYKKLTCQKAAIGFYETGVNA